MLHACMQDSILVLQSTAAMLPLIQTLFGAIGQVVAWWKSRGAAMQADDTLLDTLWLQFSYDPEGFLQELEEQYLEHGSIDRIMKLILQVWCASLPSMVICTRFLQASTTPALWTLRTVQEAACMDLSLVV